MNAAEALELLPKELREGARACSLDVETAGTVEVGAVIAAFQGLRGVATCTGEVVEFLAGLPGGDRLLSAEGVSSDGSRSARVWHDGDCYHLVTVREVDGHDHLRRDVTHPGVRRGLSLTYAEYWAPTPEGDPPVGVWRPFASRLVSVQEGTP